MTDPDPARAAHRRGRGPRPSRVRLAVLFPDLLGTYGDTGNGAVLERRLAWRDIPVEVVSVTSGQPVPGECDLYVLGGGEDAGQTLATAALASSPLPRAIASGAVVLAVCAGFQILGTSFAGPDGRLATGLGVIDAETTRAEPRLVGEIVVDADPALDLPPLTGFENHAGRTRLGPQARPLGSVRLGAGNGVAGPDGGAVDGVLGERLVGTYLHGPVLARNPALADLLLGWVVGPLAPLDDAAVDLLRAERLSAADAAAKRRRWRAWRRVSGGS